MVKIKNPGNSVVVPFKLTKETAHELRILKAECDVYYNQLFDYFIKALRNKLNIERPKCGKDVSDIFNLLYENQKSDGELKKLLNKHKG